MKDVNFVDITNIWIENAKPGKGNISFSDFVISFDNNRYDATNSILNFEVNEDISCANWFKNNIWGKCTFQPSIKFPQHIKSADLRIYGKCDLIDGNTIEIKKVGSVRKDGLTKRIKQANGQSANVLVDVSNYPFNEEIVKANLKEYFITHDWIKLVAVVKNNKLLFVWKKK